MNEIASCEKNDQYSGLVLASWENDRVPRERETTGLLLGMWVGSFVSSWSVFHSVIILLSLVKKKKKSIFFFQQTLKESTS